MKSVRLALDNCFDCKDSSLECRNLQGTVKQITNLGNSVVQFLTLSGKFLVVVCSDMNIFVYDISRRQPKLQLRRRLPTIISDISGFLAMVLLFR